MLFNIFLSVKALKRREEFVFFKEKTNAWLFTQFHADYISRIVTHFQKFSRKDYNLQIFTHFHAKTIIGAFSHISRIFTKFHAKTTIHSFSQIFMQRL